MPVVLLRSCGSRAQCRASLGNCVRTPSCWTDRQTVAREAVLPSLLLASGEKLPIVSIKWDVGFLEMPVTWVASSHLVLCREGLGLPGAPLRLWDGGWARAVCPGACRVPGRV